MSGSRELKSATVAEYSRPPKQSHGQCYRQLGSLELNEHVAVACEFGLRRNTGDER